MKLLWIAIGVFAMATSGFVDVGASPATVQVRDPGDIASCVAALLRIAMPQEAIITVHTSLYGGLAVGQINGGWDAAYFDWQGLDGQGQFVYDLTGDTGQYSCGLVCENPAVPSVAQLDAWKAAALDAIARVQVRDIPPPPTCPPTQ